MLRPAPHIRYHIAAILAAHWIQFVVQYKRWIRPVVFKKVRKVLACRTPVLGCHIYQCKDCGHVELIPVRVVSAQPVGNMPLMFGPTRFSMVFWMFPITI